MRPMLYARATAQAVVPRCRPGCPDRIRLPAVPGQLDYLIFSIPENRSRPSIGPSGWRCQWQFFNCVIWSVFLPCRRTRFSGASESSSRAAQDSPMLYCEKSIAIPWIGRI